MTEIPDRNDPAFWGWMGEAQKERQVDAPAKPLVPIGTIIKATIRGFKTGWITCLEPETGHYWQASKTDLREGDLY